MDIQHEEVQDLLEFFSKNTYNAWDTHPKVQNVMQRCLDLFTLDYNYSVLSNSNGELSTNYPSSLVILEHDKSEELHDTSLSDGSSNGGLDLSVLNLSASTNGNVRATSSLTTSSTVSSYEGFNAVQELPKIKELCSKARYARCRARFPVPVILYNKKHICRSATLSGGPEIYGRASFDYFFSGGVASSGAGTDSKGVESEASSDLPSNDIPDSENQGDWQLFDRVRNQDIRLLKAFQVETIIDLMVENKKVKFGVYVTSSEKVDKKNRYQDFSLISLPYPGCEFFKQYRDNGYNAEKLMFEWNQGHVDANISVPEDSRFDFLNLDWTEYRKWDLIRLTQNYLKLLLAHLRDNKTGMLIHCISGWDRTPLFVSLLRLSLWADGAVHKSLNAEQILYLTLAYDWLLFGHNLEDRLNKGEEILCFCFYFLSHMVGPEYSIVPDNTTDHCAARPTKSSPENNHTVPFDGALQTNCLADENGVLSGSEEASKNTSTFNNPEDCPEKVLLSSVNSKNGFCAQENGCNGAQPIASSYSSEETCQSHSDIFNQPELSSISLSISSTVNHVNNSQIRKENGECETLVPESCKAAAECDETRINGIGPQHVEEFPQSLTAFDDQPSMPSAVNPDSQLAMNGEARECISQTCIFNTETNGEDVNVNNGEHVISPSSVKVMKMTEIEKVIEKTEDIEECSKTLGNSNGGIHPEPKPVGSTTRRDRLTIVRSRFYALYNNAIGFRPGMNDNTGGSGLSVIIDNIATKVGIRAPNRSSS